MPRKKSSALVGSYIQALRTSRGWTQKQLAEALEFKDEDVIRRIEQGRRNPDVAELWRIRDALKLVSEEFQELLRRCIGEVAYSDTAPILHLIQYQAMLANSMAQFQSERILRQCAEDMHKLIAQDGFYYEPKDHDIVMKKLYGLAYTGDHIHAISWDEEDDWKNARTGNQYLDFNVKAVYDGVNVERIFIFKDTIELENIKDQMHYQRDNGIKVRVTNYKALDIDDCQNMLIISTKSHGKFTVYPEHIEGKFVKAYVSWNESTAGNFERIYRIVRSASREWGRV